MPRDDDRLEHVRSILRPRLVELSRRRPAIYWGDLLATSLVAWAAFLTGGAVAGGWIAVLGTALRLSVTTVLFGIAVLSLYRASSFIHELTHVRRAMPTWALAWDVLIGVPLLLPSFLYVGVHDTHHDHRVFGTARDPEYADHQGQGHRGHLLHVVKFALVPSLLFVRWLVLTPISFVHPGVRRFVVERLSSFAGNAVYRRPVPVGAAARRWHALEATCFVWTALVATLALSGVVPLASMVFAAAVTSCVSALHGMRSLATHRFHGDGEARTVEEQFLDSINVTGHPLWTELWSPAGLQFHALHHFAPLLPYHSLGRAHRLLLASLPEDDVYRTVTFGGLRDVARHVLAPSGNASPG